MWRLSQVPLRRLLRLPLQEILKRVEVVFWFLIERYMGTVWEDDDLRIGQRIGHFQGTRRSNLIVSASDD